MDYQATTQHARFTHADRQRLAWILDTPPVARRERLIYEALNFCPGTILEVGAGEGLCPRLRPDVIERGYVGLELHHDRARLIAEHAPAVVGDATALPFAERSFDNVFCRDLLHHLEPPARAACVREMARVLKPGGRAFFVEPNAALSPVVFAFSALIPTERMALRFHPGYLARLVEEQFAQVRLRRLAPSMLYRVLFHHRLGILKRHRGGPKIERLLQGWERLVSHAPQRFDAYIFVQAHPKDG